MSEKKSSKLKKIFDIYASSDYHDNDDINLTNYLKKNFDNMTYNDIIVLMISYLFYSQDMDEKIDFYKKIRKYLLETSVEKSTLEKKIKLFIQHNIKIQETIIKLLIKDKDIGKEFGSSYSQNKDLLYSTLTLQLHYILPKSNNNIPKYQLFSKFHKLKNIFKDADSKKSVSQDESSSSENSDSEQSEKNTPRTIEGGADDVSDEKEKDEKLYKPLIKSLNKIIKDINENYPTNDISIYITDYFKKLKETEYLKSNTKLKAAIALDKLNTNTGLTNIINEIKKIIDVNQDLNEDDISQVLEKQHTKTHIYKQENTIPEEETTPATKETPPVEEITPSANYNKDIVSDSDTDQNPSNAIIQDPVVQQLPTQTKIVTQENAQHAEEEKRQADNENDYGDEDFESESDQNPSTANINSKVLQQLPTQTRTTPVENEDSAKLEENNKAQRPDSSGDTEEPPEMTKFKYILSKYKNNILNLMTIIQKDNLTKEEIDLFKSFKISEEDLKIIIELKKFIDTKIYNNILQLLQCISFKNQYVMLDKLLPLKS
uniref:Uncharacterized protein n=1 Tax=viral metagenome TaxID=1070528 RepID=A0A6C0H709_9ZZZZ